MKRGFRLTERDVRLLSDLFGHSVITADQIVRLGYFGSLVRCRSRLRRLCGAGLTQKVNALPVKGSQALYAATPHAAAVIAEYTGLGLDDVRLHLKRPCSPLLLEHSCRITEFRIAVSESAGRLSVEWLPEPHCRHAYSVKRGDGWQRHTFKPDSFLRIEHLGETHCFFVEIDLGHVSRKCFKAKIASYRRYARGIFQEAYAQDSFAVLVVTTGSLRLRHLSSLVHKDDPRFLFTTFGAIETESPLDCVWLDPQTRSITGLLPDQEVSP
ncbi:MAG: replication-relaxation family protein [Fimbriimonadaceae bacterium]|nr:replication-relaxation family protein [Fimbriimonadaceae bacterium]